MFCEYYAHSDIGTTRSANQDAVFAACRRTRAGQAFLGVVCDGMGGLEAGEVASSETIGLFRDWFLGETGNIAGTDELFRTLRIKWGDLICNAREYLRAYSDEHNAQLGTTLSALLIIGGRYYAAQIGDSRIYLFRDGVPHRITEDHSYVWTQVTRGLMTVDEAAVSKEKNILTRCIGNMEDFSADYYTGEVRIGDCFTISSDGFHGGLLEGEVNALLSGIFAENGRRMRSRAVEAVEEKKRRGEKDNISVVCVRVKSPSSKPPA